VADEERGWESPFRALGPIKAPFGLDNPAAFGPPKREMFNCGGDGGDSNPATGPFSAVTINRRLAELANESGDGVVLLCH
jgi:hypothetical protein